MHGSLSGACSGPTYTITLSAETRYVLLSKALDYKAAVMLRQSTKLCGLVNAQSQFLRKLKNFKCVLYSAKYTMINLLKSSDPAEGEKLEMYFLLPNSSVD